MGHQPTDYLGIPTSPSTTETGLLTDGIPLCSQTGMGISPNQVYRRDGHKTSEHELEDESFHFKTDDGICLYGVFDGHGGSHAAKYVVQKMPAEILFGQLSNLSTEDEIREVLRQAFLSAEREYFDEAIGHKIAERTTYRNEMLNHHRETPYDPFSRYPHQMIAQLNQEIGSGTTAVVVLIFNGKLYVSNVGNSRALLCRTGKDGVLRVKQLSVDHDLKNADELHRLQQVGVDLSDAMINLSNTRYLGNYHVKGGYKEWEWLKNATSQPVIPDPEIHPAVKVDESFRFLVLLSDGLYQALREASESEQVDIQIAQMIVEEFKIQSSINLVAQAVVDKVSRMHHDYFMNSTSPKSNKRDDMTLLVRNFSYTLTNSSSSPVGGRNYRLPSVPSTSLGYSNDCLTPTNISVDTCPSPKVMINSSFLTNSEATTSTESSDVLTQSNQRLPLDKDGRIAPYVDFSDYYGNLASKGWTDDNIFSIPSPPVEEVSLDNERGVAQDNVVG